MGNARTGKSEISGKNENGELGAQKPAKGAGGNIPAGSGKGLAREAAAPGKNSGPQWSSEVPPKAAFINRGNTPSLSNASPSNLPAQATVTESSAEIPGGKAVSAGEFFRQAAADMGFPQDVLSVTILAFARFFSLSPGSALVGTLRRELLASGKASSPQAAGEKADLEAEALGTIAALDKGVSLSPEALAHYARFFTYPVFTEDGDDEESPGGESPPAAEEIQAIAEEQTRKDTILDFLNSLPGKNGQYWTVFPFKIKVRGTEIKVFIRILNKGLLTSGEGGYIIADMAAPKRQWRCFLEKNAGKFRADMRIFPGLPPRALKLLRKEAERFLKEGAGLPGGFRGFDEILVRNGEGVSSWVDDLCAEALPSVNEEV